tara:strand:+ start:2071 stop:2685 length:615 start_codon:yes stop_codon:yes gene_type:complete
MTEITLLNKEDEKIYNSLLEECQNSWRKQQVFRTETEMRLSVLNDSKHPTPAAKYWQAVREQSCFFQNVVSLNFAYRKDLVKRKQLQKQIEEETDELEKELLQIELEEKDWGIDNKRLEAHHRIRELEHWSRIKEELNDGSFDIKDPNTHQWESLPKRFENQVKSLTPGSSAAEVINIVGLHQTAKRQTENLLKGKPKDKILAE